MDFSAIGDLLGIGSTVAGAVAGVLSPTSSQPQNQVGIGEQTPPVIDQNKSATTTTNKSTLPSWVVPTAIAVGGVLAVGVIVMAMRGKK